MAKDEPQSYGSGKDWLTGKTGQEVNSQKGNADPQHDDFYESRRDGDDSARDQGGRVRPQASGLGPQDSAGSAESDEESVTKVTDEVGGAKRGGFFKNRDYT